MKTSTLKALTSLPYLAAPADDALAELAATMARLSRDLPQLAESARLIVLARRCLRRGLLLCNDVASDAIEQVEQV